MIDVKNLKHILQGPNSKGGKSIVMSSITSTYRELIGDKLSPQVAVNLSNRFKGTRMLDEMRKILPGVWTSKREEDEYRHSRRMLYKSILLPQRTSTGIVISASRLMELIRFSIPIDDDTLLDVKLTGDGWPMGNHDCVFVGAIPLNDEVLKTGLKHQSLYNCHPIALMYGSDTRDNLKANLTLPFNRIKEELQSEQVEKTCTLSSCCDMKFVIAFLDDSDQLSPTSADHWDTHSKTPACDASKVALGACLAELT